MSQGQRVNIQYSVDVDELPEVLSKLIKETENRLRRCTNEFLSHSTSRVMLTHENYLQCADRIDLLRRQLADIDYRLQDSASMLKGIASLQNPAQPENRIDEILQSAEETKQYAEQALAEQEEVEW